MAGLEPEEIDLKLRDVVYNLADGLKNPVVTNLKSKIRSLIQDGADITRNIFNREPQGSLLDYVLVLGRNNGESVIQYLIQEYNEVQTDDSERVDPETLKKKKKKMSETGDAEEEGNKPFSAKTLLGPDVDVTEYGLPESCENLLSDTVKTLDISNKLPEAGITYVPRIIFNNLQLTSLNLARNRLTRIPGEITTMVNLKYLTLTDNYLETLPGNFYQMSELQELRVDYNKLRKLPDSLSSCLSLRKLYANNNQLIALPDGIGNITRLQNLNVIHNLLTTLPLSMANLIRAPKFSVHQGNGPFYSPPEEVVAQGKVAICTYLEQLTGSSAENHKVQLVLIGVGEAGKTSTMRALRNDYTNVAGKIGVDERTVGIDIIKWNPRLSNVKFQILDFAGQALYQTIHQFFLSRRAVYFMVWRVRPVHTPESIQKIIDTVVNWLSMLRFRVPGASVVLVATHIDATTPENVQEQSDAIASAVKDLLADMARSGYELKVYNDCQSYQVDNLHGAGVAELREKLIYYAEHLEFYREPIPKAYERLWRKLEDLVQQKPLLSWSEFEKHALSAGFKTSVQIEVATVFFHEMGELRYFGGFPAQEELGNKKNKKRVRRQRQEKGEVWNEDTDPFTLTVSNEGEDVLSGNKRDSKSKYGTVYIQPTWMIDAMKGLIRHDQSTLLEWFSNNKDPTMFRRVKRLVVHGHVHKTLLPYFWPSTKATKPYWKTVREGDPELWPVDVIKYDSGLSSVLELLQGFDILFDRGADEYTVPILLGRTRAQILDARAYSTENSRFVCQFIFAAIPHGFFERLIVKCSRLSSSADFDANVAAFYKRGRKALLFLYKLENHIKIVLCAATWLQFIDFHSQVASLVKFFPGLDHRQTLFHHANGNWVAPLHPLDLPKRVKMPEDPVQIAVIHSYNPVVSTRHQSCVKLREDLDSITEQCLMEIISGLVKSEITFSEPYSNSEKVNFKETLVALVVLDVVLAEDPDFVDYFTELHNNNCFIIPILTGDYEYTDIAEWWPSSIPLFSKHKLFIHMQFPWECEIKVKENLLPQIEKTLEEWRGEAPSAFTDSKREIFVSGEVSEFKSVTTVRLDKAALAGDGQYVGWRLSLRDPESGEDVEISIREYHGKQREAILDEPAPKGLTFSTEKIPYTILPSFESLPCPSCLKNENVPPHCFSRPVCLLYFDEANERRVGTLRCPKCLGAGVTADIPVLDIMPPDVFLSYQWGEKHQSHDGKITYDNQEIVKPLRKRVENASECFCWLDIGGGLSAGQDHVKQMVAGVKQANVFVMFLDRQYILSANCIKEFATAVEAAKFIIPVLMPGYEGSYPRWWPKGSVEVDGEKLSWSVLRAFDPIDARGGQLETSSSEQEAEIVRRIISRFHRTDYLAKETARTYAAWKLAQDQLLKLFGDSGADDETYNNEERLAFVFNLFDTDRSGSIDLEELKAALTKMDITVTDKKVRVMMVEADSLIKDQRIDREEFKRMYMTLKEKATKKGSRISLFGSRKSSKKSS